jgi:hypothetical protein
MQSVNVIDVELEYEVTGAGEPVLLISPVIADGFLPLVRNRRSPTATSSSAITSAGGSAARTPPRR